MNKRPIFINHNGIAAMLDWREAHNNWRSAWWVTIDGESSFIITTDDDPQPAIERVRDSYIGDPPPSDHSTIWRGYTCGDCGAAGVRLWRDYQTVLDAQTLRCRTCAEKHEGRTLTDECDQIGWSVPAVPTPDGDTFWGYTSVPLTGVRWWKSLPLEVSP